MAKSKSLGLPSSTRTGDSIASKSPRPNQTSRRKHTSSGTIAGVAVGGVLILVFIIGGWSFWRRRRRAKSTTRENTLASEGQRGRDDEKIHSDTSTPGARQETSGDSQAQEPLTLHLSRDAAHELRSDDIPRKLPHATVGGINDDGNVSVPAAATARDDTALHVSPHVEAQRERESEWLEMAEARRENTGKTGDAFDARGGSADERRVNNYMLTSSEGKRQYGTY